MAPGLGRAFKTIESSEVDQQGDLLSVRIQIAVKSLINALPDCRKI